MNFDLIEISSFFISRIYFVDDTYVLIIKICLVNVICVFLFVVVECCCYINSVRRFTL